MMLHYALRMRIALLLITYSFELTDAFLSLRFLLILSYSFFFSSSSLLFLRFVVFQLVNCLASAVSRVILFFLHISLSDVSADGHGLSLCFSVSLSSFALRPMVRGGALGPDLGFLFRIFAFLVELFFELELVVLYQPTLDSLPPTLPLPQLTFDLQPLLDLLLAFQPGPDQWPVTVGSHYQCFDVSVFYGFELSQIAFFVDGLPLFSVVLL